MFHTVTARTPADEGPTTKGFGADDLEYRFCPSPRGGTYLDGGAVTFYPQNLDIKIGEGNITYTEHNEYEYLKDRGNLDTVKEGDEVPMDVKLGGVFEHITQGTSEPVGPMDAIKGIGGASEWVSARPIRVSRTACDVGSCTPRLAARAERKRHLPRLPLGNREINYKDSTISITGKCKAIEPIVTRRSVNDSPALEAGFSGLSQDQICGAGNRCRHRNFLFPFSEGTT